MTPLLDTDLIRVNRAGVDYQATWAEVKAGVPGGPSYDPDAQDYITRVETADGQALETAVKTAIDNTVRYAKTTSAGSGGVLWDKLVGWALLSGPNTWNGIWEPLVGSQVMTFTSFTAGDWDRASGLKGNGVSKWVDSMWAHPGTLAGAGCYVSEVNSTEDSFYFNQGAGGTGQLSIGRGGGSNYFFIRIVSSDVAIYNGNFSSWQGPADPRPSVFTGPMSMHRYGSGDFDWEFERDDVSTAFKTGAVPSVAPGASTMKFYTEDGVAGMASQRCSQFISGADISSVELNGLMDKWEAELSAALSP